MRILVTGASGFIGRHAALRLAAKGHRVVATGRDHSRLRGLDISTAVIAADLTSDPLMPLLNDCEAVVHCAALSAPWGRAEDFQRANVDATRRLALAARKAGVVRFIHIGSPSIYFRFADQYEVKEAFTPPKRWITHYARSKWESEETLRSLHGRVPHALILRPRAVFGEGDQAILPRLLAMAAGGRFPLIGGGNALIDITHIDNVVDAIELALQADGLPHGRAYNITNGNPIRAGELMSKVFDALNMTVRWVRLPRKLALTAAGLAELIARIRPGCPEPRLTRYGVGVIGYSQTLDISAARNELGYEPGISIDAGIRRFADYWRGISCGRMEASEHART
ncbi:MAG: NAD(P)-dependent oxidoreductase [Xanthomonadaceae bacterium]|jgi:nucleoside-diphosphate-sugar epimerase|nr:NAD(P)-dependent oxidoreductase [Xanthomonadaceae bacterium]